VASPTFVSAGTANASATTALPGAPTSTLQNDIWLCILQTSNQNTGTVPTATNLTFVEVTNSPQGVGTAASANAVGLRVYWARQGASAPGAVTVPASGNHDIAQILAFRGCATGGNPWDVSQGGTFAGAASTVLDGGFTPHSTVADTLGVCIGAHSVDSNTTTATNFSDNGSGFASATFSDRSNCATNTGTGGGFGVGTVVLPNAIGLAQFRCTLSASSTNYVWFWIALLPVVIVPLPSLITQPLTPARRR
jgi:hypothetical protein